MHFNEINSSTSGEWEREEGEIALKIRIKVFIFDIFDA